MPALFPLKSATLPILLRGQDPDTAIIKCLEGIANQRFLSASDLVDKFIADNFLSCNEVQNRNLTNIKETKKFLVSHIGPALYSIITPYINSLEEKRQSLVDNDGAEPAAAVPDLTVHASPIPTPTHVAPQMTISTEQAQPTIQSWMNNDSAFPLRNMSDLGSPPTIYESLPPTKRLSTINPFAVPGVRTKSEAGVGETNISPVKLRAGSQRAHSVSGNINDSIEHRVASVNVANRGRARSIVIRKCTFCDKELPSPSAKREHEAVHIEQLCQWKQYQCKTCPYRSTRPREVQNHMKNKHDWDPKKRKMFTDQDIIDHGPLSDERMAQLRRQYHEEKTDSVNLTQASFVSGSNAKVPDRDGHTDRDELASQHNTIISMDYSYTPQTPLRPHAPQQVSSSVNNMFGTGSHFDDANSFLIRDAIDQSSQVDYPMQEYTNIRNSLSFAPQYIPSGTQLLGVGTAHPSHLDIPPTLVLEEDAQGENDEWRADHIYTTMKGDRG